MNKLSLSSAVLPKLLIAQPFKQFSALLTISKGVHHFSLFWAILILIFLSIQGRDTASHGSLRCLFYQLELDYYVMEYAQKIFFHYGCYFLKTDMRDRYFSQLLAAGFCFGVARNGLTYSAVLFSLHFPSFAHFCRIIW